MAKHPHRLLLVNKKTWRCTLPGCTYFIHLGLAHTLPGRESICWECGETFTLDEESLKDEMPNCRSCRRRASGGTSDKDMSNFIEAKLALARAGVKKVSELNPIRRGIMESVSGVDFTALEAWEKSQEEDQIEVIEPDSE